MISHIGEGKRDGFVYVLHFSVAVMGGRKYSLHYVGWARRWDARIRAHREGRGARLTQVAVDRGIALRVAVVADRIVVGELEITGREMERYIKRQHHHKRYCPLCGSARLKDYRD